MFKWNGTAWNQLGSDIDGEAANDRSGRAIDLSGDGKFVAIGAKYNSDAGRKAGHVRVFEWDGAAWQQRGLDIDGEDEQDQSGSSVALSRDGSICAVGAHLNDATESSNKNYGHVRVFEWDGTAWNQLGSDVDGEALKDESGTSVDLSSDGMVLAVGATLNNGKGKDSGHARVFEWKDGEWARLGQDIDGEAKFDQSGHSVSLSSDGTVLVVGAPFNDAGGNRAGQARIYKFENGLWEPVGDAIYGDAAEDYLGYSVAISGDGLTVAAGAPLSDGAAGADSGHVKVFKWDVSK